MQPEISPNFEALRFCFLERSAPFGLLRRRSGAELRQRFLSFAQRLVHRGKTISARRARQSLGGIHLLTDLSELLGVALEVVRSRGLGEIRGLGWGKPRRPERQRAK